MVPGPVVRGGCVEVVPECDPDPEPEPEPWDEDDPLLGVEDVVLVVEVLDDDEGGGGGGGGAAHETLTIEAPGGALTAPAPGTFSVRVSVCPVGSRTVTVHVSAVALGSAAMPKTTSTALAVPIATRSFRLLITWVTQLLPPCACLTATTGGVTPASY